MKETVTPDALQRAGLEGVRAGETETVTLIPEGRPLEGLMRKEMTIGELEEGAELVDLHIEVADEMGAEVQSVDKYPTALNVWTPKDGMRLEGEIPEDEIEWDGEVAVRFDVAKSQGPVYLVDEGNEGLAFELEGTDLRVTQLLQVQGPADEELELPSGLERSIEGLEDEWLQQALERRLAGESVWDHFVAVGMHARLKDDWDPEGGRMLMERIMAGEPLPASEFSEATWAALLDDAKVDVFVQMASSTAVELKEEVEQFLDLLNESSEDVSERDLRAQMRRRDDLECALYLLDAAGRRDEASPSVRALDEVGASMIERAREHVDFGEDERLRRAVLATPHGWWVRPLAAE